MSIEQYKASGEHQHAYNECIAAMQDNSAASWKQRGQFIHGRFRRTNNMMLYYVRQSFLLRGSVASSLFQNDNDLFTRGSSREMEANSQLPFDNNRPSFHLLLWWDNAAII